MGYYNKSIGNGNGHIKTMSEAEELPRAIQNRIAANKKVDNENGVCWVLRDIINYCLLAESNGCYSDMIGVILNDSKSFLKERGRDW